VPAAEERSGLITKKKLYPPAPNVEEPITQGLFRQKRHMLHGRNIEIKINIRYRRKIGG
jgi:hypothetical protein